MRQFIVLVAGVSLAGCSDVVTDRYATLEEARADSLFVRGWLRDILPPSSREIRTSNDVDLNTSEGEFYFSREHAADFYVRLHRGFPARGDSTRWRQFASERAQEGLEPWWYQERGFTWVFFCDTAAGMCSYTLW